MSITLNHQRLRSSYLPEVMEKCVFCNFQINKKDKVIRDYKHCFVRADEFPVSPGHMLIISKNHIQDWFAANKELLSDMIFAINETKQLLELQYKPNGYNIGANCGKTAGQTIMHFHVHLIPRYLNDIDDPRGGVRGVIPSKQKYSNITSF